MVESNPQNVAQIGNQTKRILPAELAGRFRCMADFLKYFREQSKSLPFITYLSAEQMYVPPSRMVNKDHMRDILMEEKLFMPMKEVNPVTVPKWDELSVKNLWQHVQKVPAIMRYMPRKMPKDRLPCREYFFNVLNSLNPDYVKTIIEHAAEQRNAAVGVANQEETIQLSANMHAFLTDTAFVSGKYIRGANSV